MNNKLVFGIFAFFSLVAASREAAAVGAGGIGGAATNCISPPMTRGLYAEREVFDIGGSNFGASLEVGGGMWTAAESRYVVQQIFPWLTDAQTGVAPDLVYVLGRADATLSFFGRDLTLLVLEAKAKRESGSFTKPFKIEVAGIDLYAGSNTLTGTTRVIGPYSQLFYTVVQSYGIATARGKILGEIGMTARGVASASSGLEVEGRHEAALVLEGSAGVSIGVGGVGLYGSADLIEVGLDFNNRLGLTPGSTYDFYSSYDASTLEGEIALKASSLGASTTLWSDDWNGYLISLTTLQDQNGCVR